VQIWLDRPGTGPEACAVDLQILHYALHVIPRLGERNALDPVNRINLGIAWIAVLSHPLFYPTAATRAERTGGPFTQQGPRFCFK
jgi:hypothetical protein